jgi:hypothetical protein
MTAFRYIGPAKRMRFMGMSVNIGDTCSPPSELAEHFNKHSGFEAIEENKPKLIKPKPSKKSKKPAELPEAEKETSKE